MPPPSPWLGPAWRAGLPQGGPGEVDRPRPALGASLSVPLCPYGYATTMLDSWWSALCAHWTPPHVVEVVRAWIPCESIPQNRGFCLK